MIVETKKSNVSCRRPCLDEKHLNKLIYTVYDGGDAKIPYVELNRNEKMNQPRPNGTGYLWVII